MQYIPQVYEDEGNGQQANLPFKNFLTVKFGSEKSLFKEPFLARNQNFFWLKISSYEEWSFIYITFQALKSKQWIILSSPCWGRMDYYPILKTREQGYSGLYSKSVIRPEIEPESSRSIGYVISSCKDYCRKVCLWEKT